MYVCMTVWNAACMHDLKECVESVTVGNGEVIQSSTIGKKKDVNH